MLSAPREPPRLESEIHASYTFSFPWLQEALSRQETATFIKMLLEPRFKGLLLKERLILE